MDGQKTTILKNLSLRVDALRRAMDTTMSSDTPNQGKWSTFKEYARVYSAFSRQYVEITGDKSVTLYNAENITGWGNSVWPQQKKIFDTIYLHTLILSNVLSEFSTGISASISAIEEMLVVNLRKVIYAKPEREVEVQNGVESLLVGRGYQKGVNFDREAGKIKFSGKEFIPDFVFFGLNLAVEVKLIKIHSDISNCVEQMCADIPAYLSNYSTILFCVYDLGAIRDVDELENGIQKLDGVRICVIKH